MWTGHGGKKVYCETKKSKKAKSKKAPKDKKAKTKQKQNKTKQDKGKSITADAQSLQTGSKLGSTSSETVLLHEGIPTEEEIARLG